MLKNPIPHLKVLGRSFADIGITPELVFHEKAKTRILNIAVSAGMVVSFTFIFVNIGQQKLILALIDFLLFCGSLLILWINKQRKFLLGRLVLTFLSSILFTAGALLYRNGGEYYLIVNIVIIIIYFNNRKFLYGITLFNILLFIGIKIIHQGDIIYDDVGISRVLFNICWAFLTMVLALLFFKWEQISYQKQVEEKNKELLQLNNTKKQLFSIIAHDLRAPIGQLRSSLDLVNREFISADTFRELSIRLSSDTDQLQGTLDNLLKWSLGQLNGIKVNPEKTNLAEILAIKQLFFRQKLEQKNLTLRLESVEEYLTVDRDHLRLVLRNLISNAIKYSFRNGEILIRSFNSEDQVTIEVKDNGMGISELVKQSLFNENEILSLPGTEKEKGTGLGLKLCKEFIEKNNGSIWVESRPDAGSSFFVSLPKAN